MSRYPAVAEGTDALWDASAYAASLSVVEHMTADVQSVPATASLLDAARLLAGRTISCLVVLEDGHPAGIVSERDIVREVAADPVDWGRKTVGAIMSHPLHVTDTGATVAQAISELARHHIRRLPVVTRDGRLAGIVTQTDLLSVSHQRLREYALDLERVVRNHTSELRELEQRRDDLVDLTVHDIKNSLCVVESALDMMDQDPVGAASMIPLLRRATLRIGNLVCTLLDVNRLENGSMPLRVQDIPWATVCEPVLAEVGLMAQAKAMALNRSGESHSLVRCDPNLVERILLNLLDNAIGVAPDRSIVDIHAERRADGSFLVRVGNRGRVIPPEVLPTLFRKYRQGGENVPLRRLGGWGLGLTFCRLAVERHGGTIRAISPYVDGEGAAFEFVLPADPR
jgi:signal transduction histidine kinase